MDLVCQRPRMFGGLIMYAFRLAQKKTYFQSSCKMILAWESFKKVALAYKFRPLAKQDNVCNSCLRGGQGMVPSFIWISSNIPFDRKMCACWFFRVVIQCTVKNNWWKLWFWVLVKNTACFLCFKKWGARVPLGPPWPSLSDPPRFD